MSQKQVSVSLYLSLEYETKYIGIVSETLFRNLFHILRNKLFGTFYPPPPLRNQPYSRPNPPLT